uniref:DNA2/NAM7 helicase helicase domain-containing protein n=1 Tax=Chromera velia CCMP2878 TaxID=1169474 RepID=A0A0G4I8G2_9ALVE|eukprot:Cvel_11945.t1-p1 / transcript=Cvel_11945.t1 / gene=Cvel_11945 / organism=Chromera_velia_CCMP2878 / gene_product=NFX1-type zinc finger-containing protein 1, putative / transcript_product=NFX1-type zinc finger-containing protein 1, putative / location=Cvel_scaffold765:29642-34318(+) / protein_length=981 / sequence_SO=supercontig / SO=protein_coding / is_pseudo=false
MVAMTFGNGNTALMPHCRTPECKQPLWPLSQGVGQGGGLRCRTRNCSHEVVMACSNRKHTDALCGRCVRAASTALMGPRLPVNPAAATGGRSPSTHLYDRQVRGVDADGRLFLEKVQCRNPPRDNQIHWKTTQRLSASNLVAVVRLQAPGVGLRLDDRLLWGEVVNHQDARQEFQEREQGRLLINMLSVTGSFDNDAFPSGCCVAVLDLLTFVPESIPVLKALEHQEVRAAPFDGGALLNLSPAKSILSEGFTSIEKRSGGVPADAALSSDDSVLRSMVEETVRESELDPIREIRRDETLKGRLVDSLVDLARAPTLDRTQLIFFLDSLKGKVHLTQGPPGTGKSYVGVVMVRALLRIKELWCKANPSVGSPPILVLSYKNHAIDEFLVDLINSQPTFFSRYRGNLVRIGRQSDEPRLQDYSEHHYRRRNDFVNAARDKVSDLVKQKDALRGVLHECSDFVLLKADVTSEDPKVRHAAACRATQMLAATVRRVDVLRRAVDALCGSSGSPHADQILRNLLFLLVQDFDKTQEQGGPDSLGHRLLQDAPLMLQEVVKLFSDMEGYFEGWNNGHQVAMELIYQWLLGVQPAPLCNFVEHFSGKVCRQRGYAHDALLCDEHRCRKIEGGGDQMERCANPVIPGKPGCPLHSCAARDCQRPCIGGVQKLCKFHSCFKCLELSPNSPSHIAQYEPPDNTCEHHPLCLTPGCCNVCDDGMDYCKQHIRVLCQFKEERRGGRRRRCEQPAISIEMPFCEFHWAVEESVRAQGLGLLPPEGSQEEENAEGGDGFGTVTTLKCQGRNRKGKPCGAAPMAGKQYCSIHAPPAQPFRTDAGEQKEAVPESRASATAKSESHDSGGGAAAASRPATAEAQEITPSAQGEQGEDGADTAEGEAEVEFASVCGDDGVAAAAARGDCADEIDEADHLAHLRDVFEVNDGGSESSEESEEEGFAEEGTEGGGRDGRLQGGPIGRGMTVHPAPLTLRE